MRAVLPVGDAAALVPDGASVMIGGFMGVGSPHRLIDALIALVQVNGRDCLIQPALPADVALISARTADYHGNCGGAGFLDSRIS